MRTCALHSPHWRGTYQALLEEGRSLLGREENEAIQAHIDELQLRFDAMRQGANEKQLEWQALGDVLRDVSIEVHAREDEARERQLGEAHAGMEMKRLDETAPEFPTTCQTTCEVSIKNHGTRGRVTAPAMTMAMGGDGAAQHEADLRVALVEAERKRDRAVEEVRLVVVILPREGRVES